MKVKAQLLEVSRKRDLPALSSNAAGRRPMASTLGMTEIPISAAASARALETGVGNDPAEGLRNRRGVHVRDRRQGSG